MNEVIQERISFVEQMRAFLRMHANLLLAAGVGLLLISDVFGTHGVLAMRRSQQQAEEIQKQINQLNQQNEQLAKRVKELKTDPSAIEHIAREEMGLARKGEIIFKTTPRGGDSDAPAESPSSKQ
jgi:cell division protein FtsB